MHELLLLSPTPVPSSQTTQTLSILAGIAAAQPTRYTALHLVFAPTRAPASAATATRSVLPSALQQKVAGVAGDLFHVQLVGLMHEAGNDDDAMALDQPVAAVVVDLASHPWTLEFRDFPDVNKGMPVTSRLMASIALSGGDPIGFVRGLGYEYVFLYVV